VASGKADPRKEIMATPSTGTLTVKIPGFPQPIQFADWTHDNLYHTVEFAAGDTNEVQAFIGAQGSPIPGGSRVLTEVDTNIPRSGDNGLSEGWEALVYSIQLEPVREMIRNSAATSAFTLEDIAGVNGQLSRPIHVGGGDPAYLAGGVLFDFLRKTYCKFTVNQKIKSEGPAINYPQGVGISVFGTTTDLEVAGNGMSSPRDARAFVLPVWIQPNIAFVMKMRPQVALGDANLINWSKLATPVYGFDVRIRLVGLVKRPVQ
jgi:hypothetical protein